MTMLNITIVPDAPISHLEEEPEANRSVCAVVVTFHPRHEDIANLGSIREQVQRVVVVDNGSDETPLTALRETCQKLDINLIENGANLGIAAALNTGIRWALSEGCKWVVLFDQDSKPSGGFVEKLLSALLDHPQPQKIGIMVPSYLDSRSDAALPIHRVRAGELLVAMTSGSLMPTAVFGKEGWFDENFFIDCVDYDYCLRIRDHGWIIQECRDAVLMHQRSSPKVHRLFGLKLLTTTNYSAIRRYYWARNVLWLFRRHGKKHFLFCAHMVGAVVKDTLKITAEKDRWGKFTSALQGYMDGVFGIMNSETCRRP